MTPSISYGRTAGERLFAALRYAFHLLGPALLLFCVGPATAADKPNIIFILADDLAPVISAVTAALTTRHRIWIAWPLPE